MKNKILISDIPFWHTYTSPWNNAYVLKRTLGNGMKKYYNFLNAYIFIPDMHNVYNMG